MEVSSHGKIKILSWYLAGGGEKIIKIFNPDSWYPTDIRTEFLLNTSQECYHYEKPSMRLCSKVNRYQCFGGTNCLSARYPDLNNITFQKTVISVHLKVHPWASADHNLTYNISGRNDSITVFPEFPTVPIWPSFNKNTKAFMWPF
jgi:hypothetical protein